MIRVHCWLAVPIMYLQGLEENTRHQNAVQRLATFADLHGGVRLLTLESGRRLAYSEYGDPQGFPLFYLHSHGSSRLEGMFFHDSARAAGFRLIAMDRPGLGLSDFLDCRRGDEHVQDLLILATRLGITEFALLSWSGGAEFVFDVAGIAASRVRFQLCIAPLPGLIGYRQSDPVLELVSKAFWRGLIRVRCRLAVRSNGPARYLRRLQQHLGRTDRRVLEDARIRSMLEASAREAALGGHRGLCQDVGRSVQVRALSGLPTGVPLVFWQGCADSLAMPDQCQRLAEVMPRAVLHRVPNKGHFSFLQDSREILLSARRQFLTPSGLRRSPAQDIRPEDPVRDSLAIAGVRK